MSLLQFVGQLYSLDALDTRLTTSAKTPPTRVDPAKPSRKELHRDERSQHNGAAAPKWKTPEFLYHGAVFLILVPWMFYTAYDVSQSWNPNYSKFEHLLSSGWILGRKVDDSDAQYAGFRGNVPYLFVLMVVQPLLRWAFDQAYPLPNGSSGAQYKIMPGGSSSSLRRADLEADVRLSRRTTFDVAFNIIFLIALHGASAPKILAILSINYLLATRLRRDLVPFATWAFNIAILFANELAHGYSYATIIKSFLPSSSEGEKSAISWGSQLDSYGGLLPRWDIHFNFTVLRLISFNLDHHWANHTSGPVSPIEVNDVLPHALRSDADCHKKKQLDPANLSERDRVDLPAKAQDFSFKNYFAYTLYAPLYLAGPILTFNDFISQQRHIVSSISAQRIVTYGIRFLLALLTMEVMIHFIYVVAISKAQPAWEVYTPFQLSMLGFFNLHHIWLKLLLPWRMFRLWALLDGVDPPENVVRCMSDNYSALAFWRGWHRSFNRWIIRYIYIPMGGSSSRAGPGIWGTLRSMFSIFTTFSFVAMWHDIQLRLLVWGWLITLFILPEVSAAFLFPKSKWQKRKEAYRVICGIGAVGNILMMMSANLVGFAVGLDGLQGLVQGIVGSYSDSWTLLRWLERIVKASFKTPQSQLDDLETSYDKAQSDAEVRLLELVKSCKDLESIRGLECPVGTTLRQCSGKIFKHLVEVERPLNELLSFLEDRTLNDPTANTFSFLLFRWWLPKVRDDKSKASIEHLFTWIRTQFSLGIFSNVEVRILIRLSSILRNERVFQTFGLGLAEAIIEGIDSCRIFSIAELDNEIVSHLLESINQAPVTLSSISSGCKLLGHLEGPISGELGLRVRSFVLRWFEALPTTILGCPATEPVLKETSTLNNRCLKEHETEFQRILGFLHPAAKHAAINVMSKRLIAKLACHHEMENPSEMLKKWWAFLVRHDLFLQIDVPGHSFRITCSMATQATSDIAAYVQHFQNESFSTFVARCLWRLPRRRLRHFGDRFGKGHTNHWQCILLRELRFTQICKYDLVSKLFNLLQAMQRSDGIVTLVRHAKAHQVDLPVQAIIQSVLEHLPASLYYARRIFKSDSRTLLETCPALADHLLLDDFQHPHSIWSYLNHRDAKSQLAAFHGNEDEWRRARADLYDRIATSLAYMDPCTHRIAFRMVYICYVRFTREGLGTTSTQMARALLHAGIMSQLFRNNCVSIVKLRWVLAIVSRVEGIDVADEIDRTVFEWHGLITKRRVRHESHRKLLNSSTSPHLRDVAC
ncbi:uncharacterized protein KY384_002632 [Bacidia gigantensis]|uniref:uncharacterized protein n=1 Tax=Bacidia gigantensis TaxID=2732470 RepID=UPI001D05B625|nr:uncharacterized protein KY384_002632 [Bacidia gigantensis]KAG8532754.1 hypothetical protein KY384_002632 [Bacidia gigantensis]